MFITVDRKVIRIDEERSEEELKRIRNAMRAQESRLRKIEADKKSRGYCLDCHILLPITGKCSRCGAVWKFHKAHH